MTTSTSKPELHIAENTRFGFELDFCPEALLARVEENLFKSDPYDDIFQETCDPANWVFRFELIFNALVAKFRETSKYQTFTDFKYHQKVAETFDSFALELASGGPTSLAFRGMSFFLSRTSPRADFFSKDKNTFDYRDNWNRFRFYTEYRKYWLERGKLLELKGKDPYEHYSRLTEDHRKLYGNSIIDRARFWNGIFKIINFIPWAIVSHRDRSKPLSGTNPLIWENRIFSLGLDKLFQSEKKKEQQTEEKVIQSAILLGDNFWTHHQFSEEEPYVKSALSYLSGMQKSGKNLDEYEPGKYHFRWTTDEVFKRMYLETKKDLADIING